MRHIFCLFALSSCSYLATPTGIAIQQEIYEEIVEYIIEELQERGESDDTNS